MYITWRTGVGRTYQNGHEVEINPAVKESAGQIAMQQFRAPAGAKLIVTGHRFDGAAPPLQFEAPCCYPTRFQASGLYFPRGGCWEVTAKAADKEFSFVVWVKP